MYWLTGIGLLLVMLASLGAAEVVTVPALPKLFAMLSHTYLLLAVLCVAALLFCQRLNQRHLLTTYTRSYWQPVMLSGLLMLLMLGSGIQALTHKQTADAAVIKSPMQVYALVHIEGISDSVADSAADQGYRQVAEIRHITPVTALPEALSGKSVDVQDALAYLDKPLSVDTNAAPRVLLSYYPKNHADAPPDTRIQQLSALQPNDTVVMRLALKPLDAQKVSATGFDSYRWLKSRHIDGTATVLDSSEVLPKDSKADISVFMRMGATIDDWRWALRQHRYVGWAQKSADEQKATAVGLSLLTGDRGLITSDTKNLYQLAGISHLLAISGTHVLFLAIVLAGAVSFLLEHFYPQAYRVWARWQVRWLVMMSAAFIYALFTGFDVPAARTAWLLLIIGLVRMTLLPISSLRILLALAVVMAWADPYVLWQAGYWLSFIAVALLLQYETRQQYREREPASEIRITQRLWQAVLPILRLQCWLFVALLPLTLLLFGKISLWGLLVNVVMIGLFGWVLVPLNLLAGVLYPIVPALADVLWAVLDKLLLLVHGFMDTLASASSSSVWLYTPLTVGGLCVALLVLLPWVLPRGLLHRGLSVPPLVLLGLLLWQQQARLTGTPILYVLPMADSKLSATLLHYPHESAQATWLFLADHRDRSARGLPSHVRQENVTQQLTTQIQALGMKRLTGIVVQTPITQQDNNALSLNAVAQDIAMRLPTQYYWQAGQMNSTPTSKDALPVTPCQAKQTWQLPDGALRITAVTGWAMIEDDAVWDCSLSISSHEPIAFKRYNATDTARPTVLMSVNDQQPIGAQTQLLLDAGTQRESWQLWSLLCPNEQGVTDTKNAPKTLWLGHSGAAISPEVLQQHKIGAIATYDGAAVAAAWAINNGKSTD